MKYYPLLIYSAALLFCTFDRTQGKEQPRSVQEYKLSRLIKLAEKADYQIHFSASVQSGAIKEVQLIPLLIDALATRNESLRSKVYAALRTFTASDLPMHKEKWDFWWRTLVLRNEHLLLENPLMDELQRGSYAQRLRTAKLLADMDRGFAVPFMIESLKDSNMRFRWQVATSLKKITGKNYQINYDQWYMWWLESQRMRQKVEEVCSTFKHYSWNSMSTSSVEVSHENPTKITDKGNTAEKVDFGHLRVKHIPLVYDRKKNQEGQMLSNVYKRPSSYTTYTIKDGDTLSEIAFTHGTTVSQLLQYNRSNDRAIRGPDMIYAGEKIIIPSSK